MISTLEEVRFLRANRHPCIIDVYDVFLTEKPRCFVPLRNNSTF